MVLDLDNEEGMTVTYTYGVEWISSETSWATRWDIYLSMDGESLSPSSKIDISSLIHVKMLTSVSTSFSHSLSLSLFSLSSLSLLSLFSLSSLSLLSLFSLSSSLLRWDTWWCTLAVHYKLHLSGHLFISSRRAHFSTYATQRLDALQSNSNRRRESRGVGRKWLEISAWWCLSTTGMATRLFCHGRQWCAMFLDVLCNHRFRCFWVSGGGGCLLLLFVALVKLYFYIWLSTLTYILNLFLGCSFMFVVILLSSFFFLLSSFFFLLSSSFLSPANRGSFITGFLVLFILLGAVGGFYSARMYKTLK